MYTISTAAFKPKNAHLHQSAVGGGVKFAGFSLAAVRAMHPSGFKNTFKLHYPDRTESGLDVAQAHGVLQKSKLIIEGDLHANTRKLLELLFLSDMVGGITPQKAKQLMTIAYEAEWAGIPSKKDIATWDARCADFKQALTGLTWENPARKLILIGDVISDRGADDRLTMALLEQLNASAQGNITILAGNHDLNVTAGPAEQIMPNQAKSELAGNLANEPQMREMVKNYLSKTVMFHYLPEQKSFLSHSPVTADAVNGLIRLMNIRGLLPSGILSSQQVQESNLQTFVDTVNRFYRETVEAHFTPPDTFATREAMAAFRTLVWGRSDLDDKEDFPFRHIDRLKLIHGHDSGSKNASPYSREVKVAEEPFASWSHSVVNLDNKYGKAANTDANERPLFVVPGL